MIRMGKSILFTSGLINYHFLGPPSLSSVRPSEPLTICLSLFLSWCREDTTCLCGSRVISTHVSQSRCIGCLEWEFEEIEIGYLGQNPISL